MKLIVGMLLVVMLSGCNELVRPKKDPIDVSSFAISHPTRPLPVKKVQVQWHVINQDGEPYVGLLYKDSLEFRKFLEDIKRYIVSQQEMLCFYRKTLQEPVCKDQVKAK